ncbi:MAG: MFS transporter [Candidatus Omnitrophota bacterium]
MRIKHLFSRENFLILCWALYDTSNQFFALNVVSLYFPRWLTEIKGAPAFYYALAFGGSMIFVGLLAPVLGTISDVQKRKKHYLVVFTLIAIVFTFLIGTIEHVVLALLFFAVANFGCQMAMVFYNSLLVHVASPEKTGLASGVGRMFGYSGALLAMLLSKPIITRFGYQPVLMATAGAFLLLSLPAMIFIREKDYRRDRPLTFFLNREQLRPIIARIRDAFASGTQFKEVRLFLLMFFFGMCAFQTVVIFLGVYAGEVFGLSEPAIINLIFFSTLFAVAGSFISGFLGDRFGHKNVLRVIFILWVLAFAGGAFFHPPFHWLIGALIGLTLSGTTVVGRAWAVQLVPREQIGEVFGLYNLVGYAAGVIGPLFWGLTLLLFSPLGIWRYRLSLLSLTIFIFLAYLFFRQIPENRKNGVGSHKSFIFK